MVELDLDVFRVERRDGDGRAFAFLGALLGRLDARPASGSRPSGAWHHLAPIGVPADEIDTALTLRAIAAFTAFTT